MQSSGVKILCQDTARGHLRLLKPACAGNRQAHVGDGFGQAIQPGRNQGGDRRARLASTGFPQDQPGQRLCDSDGHKVRKRTIRPQGCKP